MPVTLLPISFSAASSSAGRRPVINTCAPSATNRFAVARPMPLFPPVTTATLPSSFPLIVFAPFLLCRTLCRCGYVQNDLSAADRVCDGFFDRREWVGRRHWNVHSARRDHRGRLRYRWRSFGRGLRMAQPKASHGNWLEDNVERADRHWSPAHRRKADERAVLRERRCEHARRRPADTIKREPDLSLTDCRFDLFRYIARIDDDDVRAN